MTSLRILPALLLGLLSVAHAHPLAPGLLQLTEESGGRVAVVWRMSTMRIPGARLTPRLPDGCAPITQATIAEEPPRVVSRWSVDCGSAGLVGRTVGVDGLGTAKIDALVRVELADGRLVQGIVRAREPYLTIPERPSRLDVLRDYVQLGFEHILTGPDHLLFVFGLLLLVSSVRLLVETITAFTVGHSVTLTLAALELARVPSGPAEVAIALSVLVLAVELARTVPAPTLMRRFPWVMALAFGLLHGLGFAGALREVGLPGGDIPLALFSFNVGIELGQLAFIAVALLARRVSQGAVATLPRWVGWVPVYAMGSLAVFWVLERITELG